MPLESDFAELFIDTVTIENWVSMDGYAKPTYGTGTSYLARVEDSGRMIYASDGKERVADVIVYFMSVPTGITERSRVTLPAGRQPRIMRIDRMPDVGSDDYYCTLYLGNIAGALSFE